MWPALLLIIILFHYKKFFLNLTTNLIVNGSIFWMGKTTLMEIEFKAMEMTLAPVVAWKQKTQSTPCLPQCQSRFLFWDKLGFRDFKLKFFVNRIKTMTLDYASQLGRGIFVRAQYVNKHLKNSSTIRILVSAKWRTENPTRLIN